MDLKDAEGAVSSWHLGEFKMRRLEMKERHAYSVASAGAILVALCMIVTPALAQQAKAPERIPGPAAKQNANFDPHNLNGSWISSQGPQGVGDNNPIPGCQRWHGDGVVVTDALRALRANPRSVQVMRIKIGILFCSGTRDPFGSFRLLGKSRRDNHTQSHQNGSRTRNGIGMPLLHFQPSHFEFSKMPRRHRAFGVLQVHMEICLWLCQSIPVRVPVLSVLLVRRAQR